MARPLELDLVAVTGAVNAAGDATESELPGHHTAGAAPCIAEMLLVTETDRMLV
jgi:hypothetical protein